MSKTTDNYLKITLNDVWYVPEISKNLFSVIAAQEKNKRRIFTSEKAKAYTLFLNKTQSSITANPAYFWNYVDFKKKIVGLPFVLYYKDEKSNNPTSSCELFTIFFQSVYRSNVSILIILILK